LTPATALGYSTVRLAGTSARKGGVRGLPGDANPAGGTGAGPFPLTDGGLSHAVAETARSEPRIREHFDRLVERISAAELTSLAQGDGFTEKKYESASIDDLLALSTSPGEPSAATRQAVSDDLQSTDYDISIPLNGRVVSFVELFTGRLRGYLQDGLGRGAQFLPMIQDVFRAEGLPLDLAYVPLVESAFKPDALSRAKAKGMWQFMRGTALENGLKHDWYIDERADPEKATRAAAKYLTTLKPTDSLEDLSAQLMGDGKKGIKNVSWSPPKRG